MSLAVAILAPRASAALPGQPFASYWHPSTLLTWNPTNDADAAFNRANTPLASRFSNPALNVNTHAKTNQAKIVSLSAFAATSGNPSQGSLSITYFAHNYWQYEDVLVFWGGSAGEGLILAPNPTVIDAAHRNGVQILGNIFFPPTAYGGQFQWVTDFLQKSGSTFPVADKLIQVAQYYGFDGWFINQETAGGSSTTATTMRDFIKYIHTNSSLHIMWYDAMTESGSISWQNQLDSVNDMFFHDGGRVSDDMFLNFSWSSVGLTSSRTLAQSYGRSPYDVYAGVDVEANGYNTSVSWSGVFPEGSAHVLSLGFYRPDWCYNSSSGVSDFYARENRFWVGPSGDPANTSSTNSWPGIAHYVAARTPVTRVPFVTSFNTGQGSRYAINGVSVMSGNWNNLSVQDVLPTWRWLVNSSGSKLTPSLDWADSFNGGTSLKVTGTLDATNTVMLFQSSLTVSNSTSLGIAYKMGSSGAATYMKLALAFEDAPTNYVLFDVAATTNAGWNTQTFSLGSYAGRRIAQIALRFEAPSLISSYTARVGQIGVWHGAVSTPAAPSAVIVDRVSTTDATTATLRLRWTHSPSTIYTYNVYRRNADNSRTWLGATPNNAYFVPQVKRIGNEPYIPIEVEAVAPDFGSSTPATASVFWPVTLVSTGSVWKYNDTGANLGTAWRAPNFDDSAWASGAAMLGYGDANGINPTTTNSFGPDANNKYITTYFRRAFVAQEPSTYTGLTLNLQRDDGAVVYLNGVEVFRSNMPNGAVNYLTLASSAVSGGDESAFFSTTLPTSALVLGTNVFAVEIHQNTNTSSDIAFDLALTGQVNVPPTVSVTSPSSGTTLATNTVSVTVTANDLDGTVTRVDLFADDLLLARFTNSPYAFTWTNIPVGFHQLTAVAMDNAAKLATSTVVSVTVPGLATAPVTFIATGAVWRYFDLTNDLGESWRSNTFNDATWASGASELGFGDVADGRPETTLISNRLQITFYFRKTFYVAEPTAISNLTASLLRDDGAVVYLNGAEVWRDTNMPSGTINYLTTALVAIGGTGETTWLTNSLPRSALVRGTNVLAVEVHQQSTSSSDVSFNFSLAGNVMIPMQPQLGLAVSGSGYSFSWPGDQGLFSLYGATNLVAPTWVRLSNAPALLNGRWQLTLPQTNTPARFFRLGYP